MSDRCFDDRYKMNLAELMETAKERNALRKEVAAITAERTALRREIATLRAERDAAITAREAAEAVVEAAVAYVECGDMAIGDSERLEFYCEALRNAVRALPTPTEATP